MLLDAVATGGQAAASSQIENYLGFPSGISGEELTSRGLVQAQKFGATVSTPCVVEKLESVGKLVRLSLGDGTEIAARAVVIATGARYRRLPLRRWEAFEGSGICFAATEIEAQVCRGEPAAVVGGANSAGQAALFLASRGSHVDLVVRRNELSAGMSDYLVRRVREHRRIEVHLGAEVTRCTAMSILRLSNSRTAREAPSSSGLAALSSASSARRRQPAGSMESRLMTPGSC